ncbi:MAG: ankyrin repeat domain-containing protein [Chitinophagaceae bacterium]
MESIIKKLIEAKDYAGLEQMLSQNPALANEGLPYDEKNTTKAHPLHRLSDGVFSGTYADEEAVAMAKIFLKHGADINGNNPPDKTDTPLIAASSLHADKLAIFFIEQGAELNHPGCHGGTALHWAAWCGRPVPLKALVDAHAAVNKKCIDFKATPLSWAIHGSREDGGKNIDNYLACVKILLDAGADKNIVNEEGKTLIEALGDDDRQLKELLK